MTTHFNGWGDYPNPNRYSTARLHGPFESDLVLATVRPAAVAAKVRPPKACDCPIEQRVTDARKRLARLNRTSALDGHVGNASDLRERWASLPLTRQHGIVAAVLDHLVVGPGRRGLNKFDESRFTPVWRV